VLQGSATEPGADFGFKESDLNNGVWAGQVITAIRFSSHTAIVLFHYIHVANLLVLSSIIASI
jgi:hypothetical protein